MMPVLGAGFAAAAAAVAAAGLAAPGARAALGLPGAWDPRKPLSLGEVKRRHDLGDEVIIQCDVIVRIREAVKNWQGGTFTVVAGAFGSGKRTAVEQALVGTCGVIVLEVYDNKFEESLEELLGETFPSDTRAMALTRAKEALPKENLSRVPVIVLKIGFNSKADARRIIAEAGCNPLLLDQIGRQVRRGAALDDILAKNSEYCRGDVQRLLNLRIKDQNGQCCEAGKQIVEALLTSGEEGTKWLEFGGRGIQEKEVMKEIELTSGFSPECAVVYNTERWVWQFCSPAHRLAAMRSLKRT